MERMETSNPTLNGNIFAKARASVGSSQTMTVQGTVNKALILLAVIVLTAGWSWSLATNPEKAGFVGIAVMVGAIAGLILAIATSFKPNWSPVSAPLYAACQGVVLGGLSAYFEQSYPGIVFQAVGLTFAVMLCMLLAYRSGWIQATPGLRRGLMIAMVALLVFYGIVWIASFFGVHPPAFINGGGILGIGFSLFVVGIASLFLVIDFDFIERASQEGLQKYMEWYGAFSLMVTLIWLYMEILRLLSKLNRR